MTISTNIQRKIAEQEISYGRALYFFFFFLLTKRPGPGIDIGSVGLVETGFFLFVCLFCLFVFVVCSFAVVVVFFLVFFLFVFLLFFYLLLFCALLRYLTLIMAMPDFKVYVI